MLLHMVANMWSTWRQFVVLFFLADMLLHMVNGMVADMVADKEVDKVANMVTGHGYWLIGPTLFRPKPYVSSKLCEFIKQKLVIMMLNMLFLSKFDHRKLKARSWIGKSFFGNEP